MGKKRQLNPAIGAMRKLGAFNSSALMGGKQNITNLWGQVNNKEMKMNKRIVFFVLLIAMAIGMAFAEVGYSVQFTQNFFDEQDVTIKWVKETEKGIQICYVGNKTMPVGRWFLFCIDYTDGEYREFYNHESLIKEGSTYYLDIKSNYRGTPKSVYIWVAFSKKGIDEYRYGGGWKEVEYKPPKEKKSWLDRKFPPLKLGN